MNRYTQLTEKQRYLIEHFIKASFSQTEISNNLGEKCIALGKLQGKTKSL